MIEKLPEHIKVDREYEDLKDKLNEIIDVVNRLEKELETLDGYITYHELGKVKTKPCDHKWVYSGLFDKPVGHSYCRLCGKEEVIKPCDHKWVKISKISPEINKGMCCELCGKEKE